MEDKVYSLRKTARFAGLLFLLWIITGMYSMLYVSKQINLEGDVASIARNIISKEFLFRIGIITDLISSTLWIFLALTFYRLFKHVNERHAKLLVAFVFVQVPSIFILEAFHFTSLMIFKGELLKTFPLNQRQEWAMVFLKINEYATWALMTFWGLWLFPLAMLVYKSRFIPRFLGIWLFINGLTYLVLTCAAFLLPKYYETMYTYSFPILFGEIAFMLWLLIKGIKNVSPTITSTHL